MALKRKLNLGFGGNLDNVNIQTLPPQAAGQLEGVSESGDKRWQFVQLLDAGPSVAGDVGYKKLNGNATVTGGCTRTIGNSTANMAWGVFMNAVTLNYYTCIRLGGAVAAVKAEASYDGLGDMGFAFTANNSIAGVNAGTAPTNPVVCIGLAAIGAGLTPSFLQFQYK